MELDRVSGDAGLPMLEVEERDAGYSGAGAEPQPAARRRDLTTPQARRVAVAAAGG
jgi:hypothetical protein